MTARYVFKVGPANRHSGYADPVTVYADTYSEAQGKAIAFRGYAPRDSSTWLISVDEVEPGSAVLERLERLIREEKKG
jgi:hypothetical protein